MERAIRGNVMNVSWRLAVSLLTALALIYVVATYLLSAAPFPELPPNEFISWTLEKALGVGCLFAASLAGISANQSTAYRWLALAFLAYGIPKLDASTQIDLVEWWIPQLLMPISLYCFFRFWVGASKENGVPSSALLARLKNVADYLFALGLITALLLGTELAASVDAAVGVLANVIPTIFMVISSGAAASALANTPKVNSNKLYWIALTLLGFFSLDIFKGFLVTAFYFWSVDIAAPWIGPIYSVLEVIPTLCTLAFVFIYFSKRLISFSFFFNKFFVYLLAGSILITCFWFLKATIESVMSIDQDSQKNVLNGIGAVLVFLSKQFAGTTDSILKRFLFVTLGRRERELRQFINEMAHFENACRLKTAFQDRVSIFLHGARVEIFDRHSSQYTGLITGKIVEADDPLAIRLRTERKPVWGSDVIGRADFRLVVPGFHRSAMSSFVAVHESADLPALRPDEVRLLQDATHQLSVSLAFLELDALRTERVRVP